MAQHRDPLDQRATAHTVPAQHRVTSSNLATLSFILGAVGLVAGWIAFGIPSIAALAMGARALLITEAGDSGRILAAWGFGLGVMGTILGGVWAAAAFVGG